LARTLIAAICEADADVGGNPRVGAIGTACAHRVADFGEIRSSTGVALEP